MNEFIEVLKNNPNHAYDYISNNYYKMSKDELKDIAKELLYAIYTTNKTEHDEMLKSVGDELTELYED